LTQAQSEAAELRQRLVQEAKVLATKLADEAQRAANVEVERAKAELRAELLSKALDGSRKKLSTKLGTLEQKQLENEFAEKIQVVGG
jgi:F0F1-type ATP synthase membrane subunit b/b'